MQNKDQQYINTVLTLFVSCLLPFSSISAQERKVGSLLPPPIPFVMETDAIESSKVDIELNMNGSVQAVHATTCNDCASEKFLVDTQTVFRSGQILVSPKDLYQYSGKSGTVVFNLETNVLTQVNFFNLED